jgi:cytochrome c oxidase assembly protein subunit 15
VGGLVTTTDAGMAVPDWPNTYGYNILLYPLSTWLAGPWDIFIEHGHRLLGVAAGTLTIGLLIVLWRVEQRHWLRWLGVVALLMIVAQGTLGGMRVLFDERTLAMLHGCTGPLFFGLTVAMVVFTSARWQHGGVSGVPGGGGPLCSLALVTCILVYLQIVLGAVLRHVPVATEPTAFAVAVRFHLLLAVVLTLHVMGLLWTVLRGARHIRPLGKLAWLLVGLLAAQLALGAGTWLVKYAAPTWVPHWALPGGDAVQEGGWLQTHVVTAHVAVGALLFATSLALVLYAVRLIASPLAASPASASRLEVAT